MTDPASTPARPGAHSTPTERASIAIALACVAAVVFVFRALGFEWVFVGDDVVFPPADAQYHLRRALYTFVNFPEVLLFDSYINHPGGRRCRGRHSTTSRLAPSRGCSRPTSTASS